jgi:hypothetical protein
VNIRFCSPQTRGTFLNSSQASSPALILFKPDDAIIDSASERGSQMNGKELLTRGQEKAKLGFVSSSTYKSDIGMHRQVGGRMDGVLGLPPSNTMTSSSIYWINNLCLLHGMAAP